MRRSDDKEVLNILRQSPRHPFALSIKMDMQWGSGVTIDYKGFETEIKGVQNHG